MKIFVFVFLTTFLLYIEAAPATRTRTRTSPSHLSSHDRQLFRELLCILKGKTADECSIDNQVDQFLDEMGQRARPLSSSVLGGNVGEAKSLQPPEGKREAFYSDWRRK